MSEAIEAVANEELLLANRELLKDDELVIVQGKVQPDRFSGGVRLNVQSVWDLAGGALPLRQVPAGRGQRQRAAGGRGAARLSRRAARHRARRDAAGPARCGCALLREHATGELDLGDSARFYPTEAALERWNAAAAHGRAVVVYE